jgi:hypothetical protein
MPAKFTSVFVGAVTASKIKIGKTPVYSGHQTPHGQMRKQTPNPHEIENPLVMKSPPFAAPSFLVKRLLIFSFSRINFRRFFFSFSSASTRAVSEDVAAFLIPLLGAAFGTGVEVLLRI